MKKFTHGQSIIEILVVLGMLAIILPALLTGLVATRSGKAQQQQRVDAVNLIQQADTAAWSVRNRDWSSFAVNGTYYPTVSGSQWNLTPCSPVCPQDANGFTTQMVMSDVFRDANGNIVLNGGTLDSSTKRIVTTVTWSLPYLSNVDSTKYFTRHTNIAYTETTQAHFNAAGTSRTDVKVQSSAPLPTPTPDDGEIVLSQTGGFGDWCNPTSVIASLDLPRNGVANALSAIVGKAAVGTGDNASGASYADVSINDPAYPTPPAPSTAGTFNTTLKTNGAFTDNQFAYLATDTNSKQGVIVRLSDYQAIGYLNIGSANLKGQSVFVVNDIAYLTGTDNKLHTFNISSRFSCTPASPCVYNDYGSVSLAGLGNKVIVVGSKAYIAVNSITNQLQIVDVSDPQHLPNPTSMQVNGAGATDVYVNVPQNRAYLVTAQSSSQPEFFLIDLSNNTVLGTYDTHNDGNGDMNPKGVVAVSGAKVILVGTGGREYEVLRVDGSYETNPAYCGGRDVNTGINGIATVFTADTTKRAFSYIITNADPEFLAFEGGPGGTGGGDYVPTGTFISQAFPYTGPLTNSTTFNSFTANIYQPVVNVGTGFYGVQLQVGVANPVNGSCTNANYTFIGTDAGGTGGTHYFTSPNTGATAITAAIPLGTYSNYTNPAKCFKYKVILNTNDSTLTPVFKDITVNYSP